MEKRYYWLKFKDDFFDSKRIKKLRKLAGGDTYIIIYLKMQLKALRTDGILEFTGVEENFADELALDIDESPEDVRIVLTYLLNYGLCECSDNVHYFLPYVVENTGSETAGTQRWRDWKNRKALESNTTPTLPQHTANAEKEIEKEIEIESRDREKNNTLTLKGSSVCAQGSAVLESYFDTFWREYPKKKSKGTALKAFNKALKRTDFDTIMEALRMLKGSNEWTKDGGQYVPYPATWLNADGWNDEVNAPVDRYDNLRKLYELTKED